MSTIRFSGEKKSIIPWIVTALVLLALLAGFLYYMQNRDYIDNKIGMGNSSSSQVSSSSVSSNSSVSFLSSAQEAITSLNDIKSQSSNLVSGKLFEIKKVYSITEVGEKLVKVNSVNVVDTNIIYAVTPFVVKGSQLEVGKTANIKGVILPTPNLTVITNVWGLTGTALSDALSYPFYLKISEVN